MYVAGHPRLHPFSFPGGRCLSIEAPPHDVVVPKLKHLGGDLAAGDLETYTFGYEKALVYKLLAPPQPR